MRDGSGHEEHNNRQDWSTMEDETESWVREGEGEETLAIVHLLGFYCSSMQCGVWPRPPKNKAWKVIPFISRWTYEYKGHLGTCLSAVY